MLANYLKDLINYISATDHKYSINYAKNLPVHPIPFFGQIETAKVITIGVNPSNEEFKNRNWPKEILQDDLEKRLSNYFNSPIPPYKWFRKWEEAVNGINISYEKGEAAHLDLSPRATIRMEDSECPESFLDMVESDIEWFFKLLALCRNAKLILLGGSISGYFAGKKKSQYLNQFIAENARKYGWKLTGSFQGIKVRGPGKIDFHELKYDKLNEKILPVFFCSVSPSARINRHLLVDRVKENKNKLLYYLK